MKIYHAFPMIFFLLFLQCPAHGFESGEHALIGDFAFDKFNAEPDHSTHNHKNSFKRLEDKLTFSYGYLIALSGDYYKSVEESALDDARLLKLYFNRNQKRIRKCVEREIRGINQENFPYDRCSQVKLAKSKLRYATLASDNFNHFGWHNLKEYVKYHKDALWFAKLTYWKSIGDESKVKDEVNASSYKKRLPLRKRLLPFLLRRKKFTKDYLINMTKDEMQRLAVYANAYADHFLTDAFSAGHIRVPRSQIDDYVRSKDSLKYFKGITEGRRRKKGNAVSGALTQYVHNVDGDVTGTKVINSNGDRFVARTDKQLFAIDNSVLMACTCCPESQINIVQPVNAVQRSISEVFKVIEQGPDGEPDGVYEALLLVPFVDFSFSEQETLSEAVINHLEESGSADVAIEKISFSLREIYKFVKPFKFEEYFENFIYSIDNLMIAFRANVSSDLEGSKFIELELERRIPEKLINAYKEVE